MDTFGLKIIASDGVFYEGRCKKLIIPAPDGEKGILANHENMGDRCECRSCTYEFGRR